MIKIMLADDHTLLRQAFVSLLDNYSNEVHVIGQAGNGMELLRLMEMRQPDVVILDLDMPVLDGHETLKCINERYPAVKTVILSMHFTEYYISELILEGAAAYLPKNCRYEDFFEVIKRVNIDGFYFSNKIAGQVLKTLIDGERLADLFSSDILSVNERHALKKICEGNGLNPGARPVTFDKNDIYNKKQVDFLIRLIKYIMKIRVNSLQ